MWGIFSKGNIDSLYIHLVLASDGDATVIRHIVGSIAAIHQPCRVFKIRASSVMDGEILKFVANLSLNLNQLIIVCFRIPFQIAYVHNKRLFILRHQPPDQRTSQDR
jgi:hypothetical protein